MQRTLAAIGISFLLLCPAAGQAPAPYAGLQDRPVKALSAQDIADLRAGAGMRLALAAELNGYPGPRHVLELADQLGLSGEQRQRAEGLFTAMKAETIPLGEQLVEQEIALDRLFAERTVTPESLQRATAAIAEVQGRLRHAHLRYHLATLPLLTPPQLHRYSELRGSGGSPEGHHDRRH
jgi:hypothetical protein